MRAYIYDTANNLGLGKAGQRLDSDGVKLFATTAAKEIADAAIQVMGGYGYVAEYVVERLWRDSKLLKSVEEPLNLIRRISQETCQKLQKSSTIDLQTCSIFNQ